MAHTVSLFDIVKCGPQVNIPGAWEKAFKVLLMLWESKHSNSFRQINFVTTPSVIIRDIKPTLLVRYQISTY